MKKIYINGEQISMELLAEIANGSDSSGKVMLALDPGARVRMQESRDYIEKRIQSGDVMYGVNTGFGAFANVRISDAEIELLQRNLIQSHSVGIGTPFSIRETRAMMVLRANTLAKGHSGIRPILVDQILEFLNHDLIPVIPSQGSVGASGDLAPLSHLALALIGEGEVWNEQGAIVSAKDAIQEKKMQPLVLKAKEGLALINGCQVMTAIGLLGLFDLSRLLQLADLAGAMSLEGLKGSRNAFDPLISAARPHVGEIQTAANLRVLLGETSEICQSHVDCDKVQDAYSLRCMPAVHGAAKDAFAHAKKVLEIEANSSTDNPLVFAPEGKILSCGNFHGMPVAFAMDFVAIAVSALANISECRISKLVNPAMSGLPAFLTPQGGLNSGFMIAQVAAASLVSENKVYAHPASVDSIPTSADKEDHVSMGTIAARKFIQILRNAENVIAIEFLCAAQAIDLLGGLQSSPRVMAAHRQLRAQVSFAANDRYFGKDIRVVRKMFDDQNFIGIVSDLKVGVL